MQYRRSSGILLHPTSLPGPYGIGDIGPRAHAWLDFLAETGCSLWQVLPLGPTGYGDSPYQCFSAFAGNPYLISPEELVKDGLLLTTDLADLPDFKPDKVDYGELIPWKLELLDLAYRRFTHTRRRRLLQDLAAFRQEQGAWLEDFALFMALKEAHQGASWTTWEAPLRDRQPEALAAARSQHAEAVERHAFRQFIFFRQWDALHQAARKRKIQIIGDIPIFVAHDSADVWAHPELFFLDAKGRPTVVAGVPPDYYSANGQLWGNPLYRWDVHQASGYAWWLERIRAVLRQVDIVRIDHFRGFCAYWEVRGRAKTARHGRWVPAPGMDFFRTIQSSLGDLPIIAEDLGVITPDVDELRETFGLPGMKIILFGFGVDYGGGPDGPFLPHNYPVNCVAYTGTHDNDTVRGWYERVDQREADFYRRYLARDGHDVSWDLIRAVWGSVAMFALAPMQDLLSLGNEARMNYPGDPSGNWTWRVREEALEVMLRRRLRELNYLYYRGQGR
jgi:4-alpha-glucanotransferase